MSEPLPGLTRVDDVDAALGTVKIPYGKIAMAAAAISGVGRTTISLCTERSPIDTRRPGRT